MGWGQSWLPGIWGDKRELASSGAFPRKAGLQLPVLCVIFNIKERLLASIEGLAKDPIYFLSPLRTPPKRQDPPGSCNGFSGFSPSKWHPQSLSSSEPPRPMSSLPTTFAPLQRHLKG